MHDFAFYQKLNDMTGYLFPVVERFPRHEKFALCTQIKNCAHNIIMMTIRMQKAHLENVKEKLRCAKEIDCLLEMLRHLIRHAHARRYLSNKKLKILTEKLAELGRMSGGLIRRFSGKRS